MLNSELCCTVLFGMVTEGNDYDDVRALLDWTGTRAGITLQNRKGPVHCMVLCSAVSKSN